MSPRPTNLVDDDGFTKIMSTIKYKTPTVPAKAKKHRKGRGKPTAEPERSDDSLRSQAVRASIDGRRGLLLQGAWGEAWIALVDRLLSDDDFPRPTRITCFGLGSLESSRIAQIQLLLMLDLAARLKITSLEAYDPAFTLIDHLLLESYSISVLPTNTHGHHPLPSDSTTTLVYMPHCPRTLYQNFLCSNWSKDALGRMVLLSNDLGGYVVREPLKKLRSLAPCLPLVVPHLSTQLLPPNFPPNDVFNDLAVHFLAPSALVELGEDCDGWKIALVEPEEAAVEKEKEKDEIV